MYRTIGGALASISALLISIPANAADLGEAPVLDALPSAMAYAFSWTGPYAGIAAGYSFGSSDWDSAGVPLINSSTDPDGFIGGVFVGYNYQFDQMVVGAEADVFFGNQGGTADCVTGDVPNFSCSSDVNFFGTLRARVGYAFDQLLVYGTGGLAYADFDYQRRAAGGALLRFKGDESQLGFALGAGVEYAASENLFIRGEYQYLNFGSSTVTLSNGVGTNRASIDNDMHQIRFGLGYRF